ncbi:MAG: 30S ribosomal protein S5 alanine N-acetyltransferase [SAR86 cluster bacterium]|uniref:30S ribosomal protein S5 alanine N-acetyltransferase n=1 Tax=SAR86 cluster bacterium TaxID=2030880 RepID=A0A2A4X9F9_9GAMM|nr:MAG: 30S ribosomal protein S5 alanine N-acetyltransferase [SAR86 cluster bacterium]
MKIMRSKPGHEVILANYYQANEAHLKKWSPLMPRSHHSVASWTLRLIEREIEFIDNSSVHFIATSDSETQVIGTCSISNIVRGVFQSCHIGYSVHRSFEGQGRMQELAQYTVDYVFTELKLHRIIANYMPENRRSEALLNRLGFEREGYAKRFLQIDGEWEDHVLNSLINKNYVG